MVTGTQFPRGSKGNPTACRHGLVGSNVVADAFPKLPLYGCRHCFHPAVCVSYDGSFDYGIFFHERLTLNTIFCLCLALIGIGLLYKGEDGATLNTTGMLMVLISALSYAIYIAGVNRPPLNNIPTISMTFYVLVAGLFLFVAKTRFCTSLSLPEHLWEWGNLLALAVLPTTVSFLCTTQAVQYIGATPTAILGVLEPVTALFIGVLVFDEAFTVRTAGGVVLIILAVALVIAGGNFTHQLVRFRHLFPRLKRRKKNSHRESV